MTTQQSIICLTDAQLGGLQSAIARNVAIQFIDTPTIIMDDEVCQSFVIPMTISMPTSAADRRRVTKRISANCSEATQGLPHISVRALIDIDLPDCGMLRVNVYK